MKQQEKQKMEVIAITKTCRSCKELITLIMPTTAYYSWQEGKLIQNVLPMLSADERELLISGICGKCFDRMFGDDDE